MSKVMYYVPIEPLVERYTQSWYDNFPEFFEEHKYEVHVIDGLPLSDVVNVGTFLDINSTVHYKNSQMMAISILFQKGKVKDNSVFFFGDLEFWGVEALRLMATMNKVRVNITGFLHAASYTREDAFEVADYYQKYTELGWLMACDKVFVGSDYHRQAVIDRRIKPLALKQDIKFLEDKIVVTGNPIFQEDYKITNTPKKKQIIISNRFDWEKRPNLSLDFCVILKDRNPDLNIVVTTSRATFKSNKQWLVQYARALEKKGIIEIRAGLTKDQYHFLLEESKVMLTNSVEENFGYCIAESLFYNTVPILKNELSHAELVGNDRECLFFDEDEIVDKVEKVLNNTNSNAYTYMRERVIAKYGSPTSLIKDVRPLVRMLPYLLG